MFWGSLSQRTANVLPVPSETQQPLAIALQGGGAYGAYAWGVLDRVLEEEDLPIAGFSGASAGAINAVVAAWGLLEGGRAGARDALRRLWTSVGKMSLLSPLGLPGASLQFDLLTRVISPYLFNPLNINPLRDLLVDMVDFERLSADGRIPLFISATNVNTGEQRIFREEEISVDVLMASSCIPYLSQAVVIDGQPYWDGGFSANPPILPLVLETACRSLLLVKLTADDEPDLPKAAPEIFARLKRILFNAPLLRDLDALTEMQKLLHRTSPLPADLLRLRDLALHKITIDHAFFGATSGSAFDPKPAMIAKLFDAGRAAAEESADVWMPAIVPESLAEARH
ncbi:patatin-like phospholipase family protein [Telmatospirillum siberiense]|uniref:Patatin n=1 Tax=Telmatospirillum siberiense TaxID=382514 RepID=A0A2N3PMH7_9PROT|nr:patatin-like phospholipase family protein [Telmatospirillum siberiense]PKU21609.1 patatin [Telmatospirillum siberiense]